jgi:hypothetical protein
MIEQLEFLKEIAGRLDSAGIPYMVTGSVASALYARPRMTRDVDVVIECGPNDWATIVELFESDCCIDPATVRDAVRSRRMFNVIHNESIVKADFIVRKDDTYRKIEFGRRRQVDIEGTSVWIAAPEDLILSKLRWSKDGDSESQKNDARSILRSVQDLDWAYLDKWADYLEIKDLLGEVKES